jgi:hypothetical protein
LLVEAEPVGDRGRLTASGEEFDLVSLESLEVV